MNKHIELVEKWLADRDSVSLEELQANREAAGTANTAATAAAYTAAADAAYSVANAADAAANATASAAYYVKRYKELTK